MNKGYLSEYFDAVAVKTLSAVDAEPTSSNQHEVGGKTTIGKVLGPWEPQVTFDVTYIWLGDEQESISETGTATWYDSRRNQPHRSAEPRLYYYANAVTEIMSAGDTLVVAKRSSGNLLFIVVPPGSSIESQLLWLFGIEEQPGLKFTVSEISGGTDATVDFAARFILDELGIEFEDPQANTIDTIIDRFGTTFPKTREFSDLARLTLPGVSAEDAPDAALLAWIDQEEKMFRRLEKRVVAERLREGFLDADGAPDVDAFVKYSLRVQNTRKSRMGYSFEHHLSAVFDAFELDYTRGAVTERKNRPDFLFPGATAYHDPGTDAVLLSMVGAKSSCKERWRQVAFEADRIEVKHLATLEPAISENQTGQMAEAKVQLVVPSGLHGTYTAPQRGWLWSISDLVSHLTRKQRHRPA